MVDVRLARAVDVPLARRQSLDTGQGLVPCALELVVVELLGEIRIGVDNAYNRGAHAGVVPICPRTYVPTGTANRLRATKRA